MQSLYLQRIMKNNADMGYEKTNPNKANFFKGRNELKIDCQKIWPHPDTASAALVLTKDAIERK
ncbi:MAG: hypothetical protein IIC00_01095 [Planctomycetes bacterium]|nr:hypothetical protein [Planctomycetota bacterium]